jgi:hypothetical protein
VVVIAHGRRGASRAPSVVGVLGFVARAADVVRRIFSRVVVVIIADGRRGRDTGAAAVIRVLGFVAPSADVLAGFTAGLRSGK